MKQLEALTIRAQKLHPALFVMVNSAVMLGLSIAIAVGMSFTSLPQRTDLDASNTVLFIAYGVVIAPIIETVLTQALGFFVAKHLKLSDTYGFFLAWLIFAIAHYSSGLGSFLIAGVTGGLFLAFSFFVWQRKAWSTAFLVTSACHLINNAFVIFIMKVVDK
jgi:hypothetical protein